MVPRMNGIQLSHRCVYPAATLSTNGAAYRSPGQASLSERRPGFASITSGKQTQHPATLSRPPAAPAFPSATRLRLAARTTITITSPATPL